MTHNNNQSSVDLVLFGAMGDLSRRKLIPALYHLEGAGLISENSRIIGVARRDLDQASFINEVKNSLETFVGDELKADIVDRFISRIDYQLLNFGEIESFKELADKIGNPAGDIVYYFSTPPSIYQTICDGLEFAGLVRENSRVVMEKPIGHCLESSKVINDQVAKHFKESQIYRIDHYLGKETVMNLLVLRFANAMFSNNWDHNTIDHVQITVAESVGIEGRWGFYDDAGQMRDMVQNHLLQILSLLAMEPPATLHADSIRDEKLKVLKALRPITVQNIHEKVVKGQYSCGYIRGDAVPGYLEEEGANKQSSTETFVAIKAEIDNWRWAGVPFYLRTGKRLAKKHSEIVVYFKQQPHNLFQKSHAELPANKLTLRLQPDEGVEFSIINKVPGINKEHIKINETSLDLSFDQEFDTPRVVDAYERLLMEVLDGNQSLFVRRDEVEQAWQWVDGIINAWQVTDTKPKSYPAGSWGPNASITLMARDERHWDDE